MTDAVYYRCVFCGKELLVTHTLQIRSHLSKEIPEGYTEAELSRLIFYTINEDPKSLIRESTSDRLMQRMYDEELKSYRNTLYLYRRSLPRLRKLNRITKPKSLNGKYKQSKNKVPIKTLGLEESITKRLTFLARKELVGAEHDEEVALALGVKYLVEKSKKALKDLKEEMKNVKDEETDLQS